MKFFLYLSLGLIFSCSSIEKDQKVILLQEPDIIQETGQRVFFQPSIEFSLFSFLQANKAGLFITPSSASNDTVLFVNKDCCGGLEGVIRYGRGPNELELIQVSTKTMNGDSIIVFSPSVSKFISIDSNSNINELDYDASLFKVMSFSFAVNENYIAFSMVPRLGNGNLISIINLSNNEFHEAFPLRVEIGYEPSIRNQILPLVAIPDGFIIAFLGDRKFYQLDFAGEVIKEVNLGESDPIGVPYKKNRAQKRVGATPYIPKIEFHKDYLYVLMDSIIWILDYTTMEPIKRLQIKRNEAEEFTPVVDFSINDDYLYVRIGREDIYKVQVKPNWYE